MIKSYRGLLADITQDTINLHTNNGKTGYKIVKFELIPNVPGTVAQETICKIYKISQTAIDGAIDFSDLTLLAAAYYQDSSSAGDNQMTTIIFDNETFNQDIFITNKDVSGNDPGAPINYYLELEQINLTEDQALVAIVKNLRNEQ
jgi:hypothetical protein